jgi:hypothetical protein
VSESLLMPGLDASTPLGFLAALGILQILDERARAAGGAPPRLAFRESGRWRPVIRGADSVAAILEYVRADVEAWSDSPVLAFRYLKVKKSRPERFGRLTPPLAVVRGFLRDRMRAGDEASLAHFCALVAETATQPADAEDIASPAQLQGEGILFDPAAAPDRTCSQTPFDFSSRNMQFLDQIDCIRGAITARPEWIERELVHNVPVSESVRTMSWDTTAKVPGAQYPRRTPANRPTTEWLAFRGLTFLPVFGKGKNVLATACRGRRLNGEFIWPVWVPFATSQVTRSLLAYPEIEAISANGLRALGVAQLFRSRFAKLGKYDAILTPTEPVGGAILHGDVAVVLPGEAPRREGASPPEGTKATATATAATPAPEAGPAQVDWSFSDDDVG